MTKKERCEKAVAYHATTLSCAQSVLAAFSDVIGLTEEQCCALGSCFGGGLRYGGVCGTVSAAAMILGILYPHTPENGMEGKLRATSLVCEFEERFMKHFEKLDCRDLLAIRDMQYAELPAEEHTTSYCDTLIASAMELLCDMLEELKKE